MTHDLKQRLVDTHVCYLPRELRTDKLINPDGPAALARIEELEGLARDCVLARDGGLAIEADTDVIDFLADRASSALKGEERNG